MRNISTRIVLVAIILFIIACTSQTAQPTATTVHAAVNVQLSVQAATSIRSISPLIYGTNFADATLLNQLRIPINRWGGNHTSRYNWQNDISNHGSDWYFENIPQTLPVPAQLPNNSAANEFVRRNKANNAQSLITVPIIGYVARDDSNTDHPYFCGFRNPPHTNQDSYDPWDSGCGNGFSGGSKVVGNDPLATSKVATPSYAQDWVSHLVSQHGNANNNGVRYYALDNEPGIWHETHRDVHPNGPGYDELFNRGRDYAIAIKNADANAQILGPVQDGWTRYLYSSYVDYASAEAEKQAHGNKPFVQWYLEQMALYQTNSGTRLLDYFDLHYYPQASNVALGGAGDANTQALRLRSTRSLWDPTYVDESWIGGTNSAPPVNGVGVTDAVQLIPRMRAWVDAYYPGTKLAISEYNWGGLEDINGALAQAEVLGIFGREGVDLATIWGPPTADQPGAYAFRMYRNYNGSGGEFGDQSLAATSSDPHNLSIFAAKRSGDQALTLMVINKSSNLLTAQLNLGGYNPNSAIKVYRYSASNLNAIVPQADLSINAGVAIGDFPANSISLLVLTQQGGTTPTTPTIPVTPTTPISLGHDVRLPYVRK